MIREHFGRSSWLQVLSITVFTALTAGNAIGQHILGTYPRDGGPISLTVSNADAETFGLDFVSPAGGLIPVPDDVGPGTDRFIFLLSNNENQVTYGRLGSTTQFTAGTTTQLSVGVGADIDDVGAAWGRGPNPVQIPLIPHDLGESALIGSFPSQGGPVSVTALGRDFSLTGFDFQSASGTLVPFEIENTGPFDLFRTNTPNEIALETLGTTTTFLENTTTTLPVGISAGASDVQAFFGEGANPQSFQLVSSRYDSKALAPIIERTDLPTSVLPPFTTPPAIEPPIVEPPVVEPPEAGINPLIGTFPVDGGPISIVANETVEVAGFDFQSPSGGLIPAEGTDAAPFDFFLSNTTNQITSGNLGRSATFVEGTITELPVGVVAGTEDIQAFWGDGPTPVAFSVGPVLDNGDNLLGGGDGTAPVDPPATDVPNGGGMQNPSAVPEPSSLLVWVTLGMVAVFQRWRGHLSTRL